jgi:dipeptidyl aminopeptidase/acylaminoacyl peptidase
MCLERHPEAFHCAFSVGGICDLVAWMGYFDLGPGFLKRAGYRDNEAKWKYLGEIIGDTSKDKAMLRDISPLNHPERVQGPIMLAAYQHPEKDELDKTDEFADALKREGRACEMHVFPWAKNNAEAAKQLDDYYALLEDFLGRNLR